MARISEELEPHVAGRAVAAEGAGVAELGLSRFCVLWGSGLGFGVWEFRGMYRV